MKLRLNGHVTSDENAKIYRRYGYDVCCPEDIREAIENCKDGEELVLELNSGGGSVYAGFEMYSVVRGYPGHTVAHVQSIAGSAMSAVMSGCDEVLMSPVANVFIHRASTAAWGNSRVMGETKQMLDIIDESILNGYEERVKGKTSREKLLELMRRETFLTAQRAIELGFADGILPPGAAEDKAANPAQAVASFQGAFGELPPIEDLRRREREAESGGGRAGVVPPHSEGAPHKAGESSKRLEVSGVRAGLEPAPTDGIPTKEAKNEGKRPSDQPFAERDKEAQGKRGHTNDLGDLGGMNMQTRRDASMEEIKTVEQLAQAYPELAKALTDSAEAKAVRETEAKNGDAVQKAVQAERERILGIEDVAVAGFEDLIAKAKADPAQNASTVAVAIVKAQKEQGAIFLDGRRKDAEAANAVPNAAAPGIGEETATAKADADAREAVGEFYGKKKEEK